MPSPAPLQPTVYYHIYNRGNNREDLFVEDKNYPYFFHLYVKYIELVAATYAYCLLRNHFHLLVRILTEEEQAEIHSRLAPELPFRYISASQAFANLFNAYTKSINSAYSRSGSLFEHPFHRIAVQSSGHFTRLVTYIHRNPEKHGFVEDFRSWPFSSYKTLVCDYPTRLKRQEILDWFHGLHEFEMAHQHTTQWEHIGYLLEMDSDRPAADTLKVSKNL